MTRIAAAAVALIALTLPDQSKASCPLSVADWGYLVEATPAGLTGVVAVAAGGFHGLALKSDGTVMGWGENSYGQAIPPADLTNVIAISGGAYHSLALKSDGTVVGWGYNDGGMATPPTNLTGVAAIAAGAYHSLALKDDGTVVGWGANSSGEAPPPTNLAGVMAIAGGYIHSLALLSNGTVVAWGDNFAGQANPPTNLAGVVAIAAGYEHSLALKSDGTVVGWGTNNYYGEATPPTNLTGVAAIATGYSHSLALRSNGTIVAWGEDSYEQATAGGLASAVLISASGYHNVALTRAPAAPLGITVEVVTTNQVDLSWRDNAADSDGFNIERAPDLGSFAGIWAQIAAVVAGITNYSDMSVSSNSAYWYRVRAHSSCGDSVPGLAVMVALRTPEAPYVAASIGVSNVVEVTWYEYSTGVNGFRIQRALDAGGIPGAWTEIATTSASNSIYNFSYNDAGATPNATNWYRVQATNSLGSSDYSFAASLSVVPPAAPTELSAIPFPDSVSLSWTDFSGGVMGFKVEMAPDVGGSAGAWTEIAVLHPANPGEGFYNDMGLTLNTTRWYRIRAYNWIGDSPYSSPAKATIVPPPAPLHLIANNGRNNQIDLTWVNTNSTVIGFKIERALNNAGSPGAWNQIADIIAPSTHYSDAGLELNQTYWYRVRAYNHVGDSPYSSETGAFVRDGQLVKVMQWNVERYLGRLANNGSYAAQCISRIINHNQPDILLLNEIDTQSLSAAQNRDAIINWVTNRVPYLGTQPGVTFYVAVSSQTDGFIRNAAISRYPILSPTTYNDGLRGLHSFKVQLSASNALQVFHTHLKCCADDCARKQNEAQFDTNIIGAFAATNYLPYIFAGDWNEEEERQPPVCTLTATYHPITTIRQGAMLADFKPTTLSGEYRTWSSLASTPSIRFDYILCNTNRLAQPTGYVFSSMDWAAHGQYNGPSDDSINASDHYPVFANYLFPGPFQIWQVQYFDSADNPSAAPDVDADGDGMSNLKEFHAGTSPTNNKSALRITAITQTNNDFRISWSTAGGRTNVVQAASSLNGPYTNISPDIVIAGSGDTVTNHMDFGVTTNAPARFYRVRLVY